jgi:hypothetical protein
MRVQNNRHNYTGIISERDVERRVIQLDTILPLVFASVGTPTGHRQLSEGNEMRTSWQSDQGEIITINHSAFLTYQAL